MEKYFLILPNHYTMVSNRYVKKIYTKKYYPRYQKLYHINQTTILLMDFMVISNFSPSPGIGWKKSHIFPMHPNAFPVFFPGFSPNLPMISSFPRSSLISSAYFSGLNSPWFSHHFPDLRMISPGFSQRILWFLAPIFPWFSHGFPHDFHMGMGQYL